MPFSARSAPRSASGHRCALPALACLLLFTPLGCKRVKQKMVEQVDSDPKIREQSITSARNSCISSAEGKLPNQPALHARLEKYCDCFATKGMSSFSNSELVSIGLGGGKLTPEQQNKLMQGVQICQGELSNGGRPEAATPPR